MGKNHIYSEEHKRHHWERALRRLERRLAGLPEKEPECAYYVGDFGPHPWWLDMVIAAAPPREVEL